MNLRDLLRLTLSNLNRMRGRAVMTAMGVVVGTTAIVVLISLASGLQKSAIGDLSQFGPINQITVYQRSYFRGPGGAAPAGEDDEGVLTQRALERIARMDGVQAVTPREQLSGMATIKLNRLAGSTSITGIDPLAVRYMDLDLARGSDHLGRHTVIVGWRVAESFVDPRRPGAIQDIDPLDLYGKTLMLELSKIDEEGQQTTRTIRLRVGGVLAEGSGQDEYTIFMALDELEDLNVWYTSRRPDRRKEGYNQATVIVEDPQRVLEIERQLLSDGFFAFSARSTLQQINILFAVIQAVFGGIGAIALVVAAIGIANTMIMSILERTREIGLMKAVGATNRDVMSIFIAEAGVIGVLGGIGGVVFGIAAAKIIDVIAVSYIYAEIAASGTTPDDPINIAVVPLWLPLFAIGFSLIVGLASGIYPALRAVQLNPVTALKYE